MLHSTKINLEASCNCVDETCSISGSSIISDITQSISPVSSEADLSSSDFNINNLNLHSSSCENITSLSSSNENLKLVKPEVDYNLTTNYITQNDHLKKNVLTRFINYAVDHRWLKMNELIDEKVLIRKFHLFKMFNPSFSIPRDVEDSTILNDIRKADLLKEDFVDENHNVVVKFENHIFQNNFGSTKVIEEEANTRCVENELKCTICKKVFKDERESKVHNISELHILNHHYRNDRKWFSTELFYLEWNKAIDMELYANETKEIEIIFKNIAHDTTVIEVVKIFELVILNDIKIEYLANSAIDNGNSFKLKLITRFSQEGAKIYPLVLKLSRNESEDLDYLLIEPKFNVCRQTLRNNYQETDRNLNEKKFATKINRNGYPQHLQADSRRGRHLIADLPRGFNQFWPEMYGEFSTEQRIRMIPLKMKEQQLNTVPTHQSLNDRFRPRPRSLMRGEVLREPSNEKAFKLISAKIKEHQSSRSKSVMRNEAQNRFSSQQSPRIFSSRKAREVNKFDRRPNSFKRSESVSAVISEKNYSRRSHEHINLHERSVSCETRNIGLKPFIPNVDKVSLKIDIGNHHIPKSLKTSLETFKASSFTLIPKHPTLKKLFFNETNDTIIPNEIELNISNYCERFQHLLWIEEFKADQELHSYDKKGIHLISDRLHRGLYGIKLEGLSEGRPSVLKGDILFISVPTTSDSYRAEIKEVEEEFIYVKCSKMPYDKKFKQKRYNVTFILNRSIMNLSHHFLNHMSKLVLKEIIFPSLCNINPLSVELKPFFNESIALNELQSQAIRNIVQNSAFPAPYIIFGPPGTGKTATFVEAIVQIWNIFETARICVCASSNTASDVITRRLMKYLPNDKIMRIYGLSRSNAGCSKEFEEFSNFRKSDNKKEETTFFPDIVEFVNRRVVVMTPVMAGKVIIKLKAFRRQCIKFDYLFIDEASHSLESDLLIPIAAFYERNPSGRIILAGDPKQLGPVVQSNIASELGFGMSYLERLMKTCELYKKDPITSEFNPKVITKLVNNYRSHEKILFTSNYLFYENELQIKASMEIVTEFCSWSGLPTSDFPIIFHSVKGRERQEKNSPSYFNLKEIGIVEKYLKELFNSKSDKFSVKDEDIGIISPYKQQVLKIRKQLSNNQQFREIAVASVEEFQGQEKKIMLISTVRSRFELIPSDYKFGLGFLRNEKRLNVALSRAMALLIVIGNPDILQCDPHWKFFIDYCIQNGSFVGEKPCLLSDSNENVLKNLKLEY